MYMYAVICSIGNGRDYMDDKNVLSADELLEHIFHYMNKLVVEKDFYKSLILLTDLGKTLVNAHRASFWYRDEENEQYWTLAAVDSDRITIPKGTGIVGASIENNETILINNPYEDDRFNADVDKQTGYVTKSILCMPVTNHIGKVIGAYQVINKLGDNEGFDNVDVKYLALAAAYCGKNLETQLLKEQSIKDQLTGLKNRKGFNTTYTKIMDDNKNSNSYVLMLDIDFFKKVNDTYGHDVGDKVLVHVSNILKQKVGDCGEVFRWGGEEFVILIPESDSLRTIKLAQTILKSVENSPCVDGDTIINVTLSGGVTMIDRTLSSVDNIKTADDNLYQAKEEGRNRIVSNLEMPVRKLLVIPNINEMEENLNMSNEYELGFEYNDFFVPELLDDEEELRKRIDDYKQHNLPENCTVHGAFYDVIPFSADARIREISIMRIKQSIECAMEIGAKAVIFHTNYNPFLSVPTYIEQWIAQNIKIWGGILEEYPDINIYLENMFDRAPDMLLDISKELSKYPNYGICFDYAHAALSDVEPEKWAQCLKQYIKHIHISDNDLKSDLHLAWGDGQIDRSKFYATYEKYMRNVPILIEISSVENKLRSIETLKEDGFI